jgi:ElaB/YqjD/DUF883 family membrane-anchored ribosome-binding protein
MSTRKKDPTSAAERSLRETRRDFDKRIDEIRAELKEKGPEVADKSLGDLKAGLEERLSDLRESYETARETIESARESFDDARESFDDALATGRTTIQERPLMAVGVALAVGVVIGLLFGPKRRD